MTIIDHHHFTATPSRNEALRLAWRAVRYAAVLGVWLALLIVRPRLALQILRERRPRSPSPRFGGVARFAG